MDKKGMTWQQLALAIIAIVVVVIVIILFRRGGERGFGFTDSLIGGLEKDTDGDGIKDSLDQCNEAQDTQKPPVRVDENGCTITWVTT